MAAESSSATKLTLAEVYLIPSQDGGLTMRAPRRSAVLRGTLVTDIFPRLLPLLDGSRTATEIAEELSDGNDPRQMLAALAKLEELGVVEPAYQPDATVPADLHDRLRSGHRFYQQYGGDADTMGRISDSTVLLAGRGPLLPAMALNLASGGVRALRVAGQGDVESTDVAQSTHLEPDHIGRDWSEVIGSVLKRTGLTTQVTGVDFAESKLDWQRHLVGAGCAVLALDSPVISMPWVDEFNKAALAAETAWTSASLLQRAIVHVGPSVLPGETACWKCFEYRFKSNLSAAGRYDDFEEFVATNDARVDHGTVPAIADFTGSLAAFEALRILGAGDLYVRTAGVLLTLDLWELRMDTHPVLKLPRCPHCSAVSSVPQERLWS